MVILHTNTTGTTMRALFALIPHQLPQKEGILDFDEKITAWERLRNLLEFLRVTLSGKVA